MIQKLLITLAGLGFAAAPIAMAQTPPAATYYVATTGSDENTGTSPSTSFLTIQHALSLCNGGQTIAVAPGTYTPASGSLVDDRVTTRTAMVTIFGWGATQPVLQAATGNNFLLFLSGKDLTFENFAMRSANIKQMVPVGGATNVVLENCDIADYAANTSSGTGAVDVQIAYGCNNITVEDCYIHDSGSGIGAPAPEVESNNISLIDNTIRNMTGDAIQFGYWNNVTITGNVIDGVSDPAHVYHNDGIQFTGSCVNVTIANNVIANIADQGMLTQAAFAPNINILVENNLIFGIGGVAIQNGSNQAYFINNTIFNNGIAALWLRAGLNGDIILDSVVANNALQSFAYLQGASSVYEDYNYLPKGNGTGIHDIFGTNPNFVSTSSGNYHPASGSPLFGAGVHSFSAMVDGVLTNFTAPADDLDGVTRGNPPAIGAFETPNNTYADWCIENNLFGPNALPTAVLAGDGLNDLYKYALGLQPLMPYNPGAPSLPSVQTQNALGKNYLTITFDGVATDVTYTVQATSDLTGPWTTIKTFNAGSPPPGNQTVPDTQAIGVSPQRFMRLMMTLSE